MTRRVKRTELSAAAERVENSVGELIRRGDLADAVQVLRDGLKATKSARAEKNGKRTYVDTVDHATRIVSARLLIEFGSGKAIQRIHQHNTGDETPRLTPREIFGRLAQDGEHMVSLLQAYVDAGKAMEGKRIDQVIDLPTLAETEGCTH